MEGPAPVLMDLESNSMQIAVGLGGVQDAAAQDSDSCLLEVLPGSCWSVIVDKLAARDLLRLGLTSKGISSLLGGVAGLWAQACSNCFFGHSAAAVQPGAVSSHTTGSCTAGCNSRNFRNGTAACAAVVNAPCPALSPYSTATQQLADQQARQILTTMLSLAYTTSNLRPQLKPQSFLVPPWLPAQPGKARGFVKVGRPEALSPALMLSEVQVHWLSWGCLSGHSGGVFASQCSSSPRSRQPCAFMAAVVINKQLLAELYVPSGCKAPDRWGSLHQPMSATATAAAGGPRVTCCSSVPADATVECGRASGVQFELWVNTQLVSLDASDAPPAAVIALARGFGGRRQQQDWRGSSSRSAVRSSSSVPWNDVHDLLMECISSNAARARAVAGTTLVPPGTATAAVLEKQLARLVAAGAPVLDLRRLQYCSSNASTSAACYSSAARSNSVSFQHVCPGLGSTTGLHQCADTGAVSGVTLAMAQQRWWNEVAVVQAATTAAVAEQCAAAMPAAHLGDDSLADVLAAVVKQLHVLAPDVQVLVLPVLLPGGRVGQRLPGGRSGSSRLSAPRLLSLNVPYLVPLRHEWDKLQQLKQVLLMVGPPAALPAPAASADAAAAVEQSVGVGRGNCGRQLLQRLQQRTCKFEQTAGQSMGVPGLVRGVFSQQQLEQEWQQQVLGQQQQGVEGYADHLQELHEQLWDEEAWFEQELGQQQPRPPMGSSWALPGPLNSTLRHLGGRSTDSHHSLGLADFGTGCIVSRSEASLWGGNAALPGYALVAAQGMLLSCMDRSAPSGNTP